MSDLVERLRHAAATASNDDLTEPMSEKRFRHSFRIEAMLEAADEIERLRAELQRTDAVIWEYARSGQMPIDQFRQHRDEALARYAVRIGKAEGAGA